MPLVRQADFDFRPDSYWDPHDVAIANIVGDVRKACVFDAVAEGRVESLPPHYYAERLSEKQLKKAGRRGGLAILGGEKLPEYWPGETEIARLTLHPAIRATVVVRARREDDEIHYRVVADPPGRFEWPVPVSSEPLTFEELTDAIWAVRAESIQNPLLIHWWTCSAEESSDVPHAIEQVKALSFFYPKLSRWYQQVALLWAAETLAVAPELGGELADAKSPDVPELHRAVLAGDDEKAASLIEAGHTVNQPLPPSTVKRRTRSGFAVNAGMRERLYRLLEDYPVAMTPLATPLHLAAANGHDEIVELLLEAGSDLDRTDANGNTAADLAELYGFTELAERLDATVDTQTH